MQAPVWRGSEMPGIWLAEGIHSPYTPVWKTTIGPYVCKPGHLGDGGQQVRVCGGISDIRKKVLRMENHSVSHEGEGEADGAGLQKMNSV